MQRIPSGPEATQLQQKAGYMYATFLTCTSNFILATRDGPYMSPISKSFKAGLDRQLIQKITGLSEDQVDEIINSDFQGGG